MHIRDDLNRFTVFENMRYLKYVDKHVDGTCWFMVQDVIALTILTQEVYALSVVIWEVIAPKWFDLWL